VLEDIVHLGYELHVAVLDTVVHHFDIVAGADGADVGEARPVRGLRGALGEDCLHRVVRLAWTARHEAWAMPGTFLATRNTHSDKEYSFFIQLIASAD
jgi:hypothetical protein